MMRRFSIILALAFAATVAVADDEPLRVRTNQATALEKGGAVNSPVESRTAEEQPIPRRSVASASNERPISRSETAEKLTLPESSFLTMFWPLLVVLGVVMGIAAAVKKWMPGAARVTGGGAINILARQYVSSKQSLCLVRLGRRVVLIGMTPDSMSTLSEVTDADEIATIASALERGKACSFSTALSKVSDSDAAIESAGDESFDESDAKANGRLRRFDESESRVSDLIERIRALSVGRPSERSRP